MKRAHFVITVACVLSVCACISYAREPSITETDYLIPVDRMFPDYDALLRRKLFVTPAHFARVVDLPSGDNEVVLAIYSDGSDSARITYTRPEKRLWGLRSDKGASVSVVRLDAPFPKALAVSVSAALRHLLDERRPPMKTEIVILDGREIEFSAPNGRHTARGVLHNNARGRKGRSLRHLTDLLQRYCQAKASERHSVSQEIATEAQRIVRYPIRRKA